MTIRGTAGGTRGQNSWETAIVQADHAWNRLQLTVLDRQFRSVNLSLASLAVSELLPLRAAHKDEDHFVNIEKELNVLRLRSKDRSVKRVCDLSGVLSDGAHIVHIRQDMGIIRHGVLLLACRTKGS
eukprot:3808370-Amphidinium_carterae.1